MFQKIDLYKLAAMPYMKLEIHREDLGTVLYFSGER
jgi:hypothetical protein